MACSCTGAKPSSLRNYYLKALVVVVDPCESRGLPLSLRLSRESPAGSRRRCDLWAAGGTAEAGARLAPQRRPGDNGDQRSEEHTSELQSLMRISYAVFCLQKKTIHQHCN